MIRRRCRVVVVALLFGLTWFLLLPSLSHFYSESNPTRGDNDPQIKFNNLKFPTMLESHNFPVLQAERGQIKHIEAKEDDFSEIEFNQVEEHKLTFPKVVENYRSNSRVSSRTGTLVVRRQRILTPLRSQASDFILPSVRINSPGLGHKGRVVRIDPKSLSSSERKAYDVGWETYFHNEYVNNLVSAQRVLQDVRDPACRSVAYYMDDLPDASIVIVFHNEAWKTLLRTVHSVLDRSPSKLIKEIILVDDASTHGHLKSQLSSYMQHLSNVRIIRLMTQRGASHARHIGASLASAQVVIFLDAHCECTTGWLEPLLMHVAKNASNVAIPVLDIIDDDTFAYKAYDSTHIRIGGFSWNLAFQWTEIPDREKQRRDNDIDPIRNPVMWGGIFAISRNFLNQLGGFDQSLSRSGPGQNLEMSFKIWMCGGSVETIPCSHVGHLFHQQSGYRQSFSRGTALHNYAAVAHMWLDDFQELHFRQTGQSPPQRNISADHWAMRQRLRCHSFDWYLRYVYPDLFAPSLALASGKIRSKMRVASEEGKAALCLTTGTKDFSKRLDVANCRSLKDKEGSWLLSRTGEIRQESSCLDYPGGSILIYPCHGGRGNQEWTYSEDRTIVQVGTKRCLTLSSDTKSLSMQVCDGSDFQVWYWKRLSEENDAKADRSKGEKKPLVKQELAAISF